MNEEIDTTIENQYKCPTSIVLEKAVRVSSVTKQTTSTRSGR